MARPKKQDTEGAAPSNEAAPAQDAPKPTRATSGPPSPNAAAEAFAKIEPELAALAPEALATITVDLGATVNSVMAAVPRILEHRDAIAEQLPRHPIAS